MTARHPVAFVFPAGGSGGAVQVGIARALLERGVFPDVVIGCSVGALNACFMALDPSPAQAQRLEAVWLNVDRAAVFGESRLRPLVRLARRQEHVYEDAPLRALIDRFCPVADLSDLSVQIQVVTTNLDNGVSRWWSSGPAADILYASACLPGLFPPVRIGGKRHVDGGVLDPYPVRRAVDLDVDDVYVLGECEGSDAVPPARMTALDVLLRSFAIARYASVPDAPSVARSGQRVIVVPGASTAGIDIRDFRHTRHLVADSYDIAARFLGAGNRSRSEEPASEHEAHCLVASRRDLSADLDRRRARTA
jgi:NTE family protein